MGGGRLLEGIEAGVGVGPETARFIWSEEECALSYELLTDVNPSRIAYLISSAKLETCNFSIKWAR